MKKVSLLITVIIVCVLPALSAVDLQDYGIRILSSTTEEGVETSKAVDSRGRTFELQTRKELTSREADSLMTIINNLYSWDYLEIDIIRIAFLADRIEFTVIPESFSYQGTDFIRYLPSGMQFYYTDYIEYNFRMLIRDYVVKVRGQFFSEDQLCEKMIRAVENPVAYIQTTDPQYLFQQITELWKNIEDIHAEAGDIAKLAEERWQDFRDLRRNHRTLTREYTNLEQSHTKLQDDYDELRNDHEQQGEELREEIASHVARAEKALAELSNEMVRKYNELHEAHEALTADFNQLKTDHEALRKNHEGLLANVTTLKQAILMAANQGIFSIIGKSNMDGIKRYIGVRRETPDMSRDNAVAKVKEEGLKLSGKEALLVDMIYFGEFDEKTK